MYTHYIWAAISSLDSLPWEAKVISIRKKWIKVPQKFLRSHSRLQGEEASARIGGGPGSLSGNTLLSLVNTGNTHPWLVSARGHALKQVQTPPKGPRELQFYQIISSSADSECQKWRELAPAFHGTEMIVGENGKATEHLVLGKKMIIVCLIGRIENLFCVFRKPNLRDD